MIRQNDRYLFRAITNEYDFNWNSFKYARPNSVQNRFSFFHDPSTRASGPLSGYDANYSIFFFFSYSYWVKEQMRLWLLNYKKQNKKKNTTVYLACWFYFANRLRPHTTVLRYNIMHIFNNILCCDTHNIALSLRDKNANERRRFLLVLLSRSCRTSYYQSRVYFSNVEFLLRGVPVWILLDF